ncbi:MAG: GTP 3',8-cyclase MoaA [Myxococcota bacterium]
MNHRDTIDGCSRPLRNLRLSVTDRCNLRCRYCMPEENYTWLPTGEILSFEEISTLVDRFVAVGVRKVRLTGGEPLVRKDLAKLIALLAAKPLDDLALTTNGILLEELCGELKAAGLTRITVSLDTLSRTRFLKLTRRDLHAQVLAGIAAARRVGLPLKLDTVLIRGVNDDEVLSLLDFAAKHDAEVRFIEYMDVGGATEWSMDQVVSRQQLLAKLSSALGPVAPLAGRGSAPAERFQLPDGRTFGIIASTTQPFCATCDRARLTADGQLFTCLYATKGLDLKAPLRSHVGPEALEQLLRETWAGRVDRGAEQRLALREARGPLATQAQLKTQPHLEMHTRGG